MKTRSFAVVLAGAVAAAGSCAAAAAPLTCGSTATACDPQGLGRRAAIHDGEVGRQAPVTRLASDARRSRVDTASDSSRAASFGEPMGGYQYGGDGTYAYGPNGGLAVYSAGAYSPGPRIIHIPRGYGLGVRGE